MTSSGAERRPAAPARALAALAAFLLWPGLCRAGAAEASWTVPVDDTLRRLLAEQDTDGDRKITADDRGRGRFELFDAEGAEHPVEGCYALSLLLQELKLAQDAGRPTVSLSSAALAENPVDRTSRLIRELYWDSLTRRIDRGGLQTVLQDEKSLSADGWRRLYVPASDRRALAYFRRAARELPELKLKVERLPRRVDARYVRGLDGRHGLLSLALTAGPRPEGVPFVVPGGRFNEMYGWDSYFIARGLLVDGKTELARAMVDDHVYQIENYGRILNANRSYYLTRSQPPFLSSMLRATYAALPHDEAHRAWLRSGLAAVIREYRTVWTAPPRRVDPYGLSRYYDEGAGPCPEVEPGHYDPVLKPYADAQGVSPREYLEGYLSGRFVEPRLAEFFLHDRAVRESGHDTTYRFDGRTADFLTVDLNALLYKVETDVAEVLDAEFGGSLVLPDGSREDSSRWKEAARLRKERIDALLWDPEKGMYFDYDLRDRRRSGYVSATTFYPLWAGLSSPEQARAVVRSALPELELAAGLAASSKRSRGELSASRPERQWDYPNGWAPHQILAWEGLERCGLGEHARRLAYRWLYAIARNARDYNGTVPEKLDVEKGSHKVFAEYGNVGTQFAYITKEGFGWMNASFQLGLKLLTPAQLASLRAMTPPERVFR